MSIYTMGIDVGSTASKCVILKDGSEIVSKSLVAVGTGTSGPSRAIAQVLENAGMTREQMDFVLATGYGRNSLDGLADMQMSELSCHAKGAAFLFPNVRTVVDIGGQDVKVIEIENGMMKNFVMNDKCAAGTGRFLDVMARVLEVKVEELGNLVDELLQHPLRHVIVGDDALPQGADGHDVAGGPAQHGLGLGAHLQELAGILIHGNDGGFVEDHALALHIDQDGCRPQVDADVFRPGHNSTSQKKFSLYRLRAGMARLVARNLLYL